MVTATHNHAGPAVTHAGDVPKDDAYAQYVVSQVVKAFGHAGASLAEAELGFWARGGVEGSAQPAGGHARWDGTHARYVR
jgi:hypothetical protein